MRSAWNEFQVNEGARRDPVGSVESGVQDHFQGRPRKFAAGAAPTWPEESSFDELTDRLVCDVEVTCMHCERQLPFPSAQSVGSH